MNVKMISLIIIMLLLCVSFAYTDDAGFDYEGDAIIRRLAFETCSGNVLTDKAGYTDWTITAGTYSYSTVDIPDYSGSSPVNCSIDCGGDVDGHMGVLTQIADANCYWTLNFWISDMLTNNFHILDNQDVGSDGIIGVRDSTASQMNWIIDGVSQNYADATMYDGNWHMVTIVQNGSSNVKTYINGSLESTNTNSMAGCGSANDFYVAQHFNGGAPYLDGKLTDITIWNRTLSQENITVLFAGNYFIVAPDTDPPIISNINCTSFPGGDITEPYNTSAVLTPSFIFDTDETATCGISDANSSFIDGASGSSHDLRISYEQRLNFDKDNVFLNCTDTSGNSGYTKLNVTTAPYPFFLEGTFILNEGAFVVRQC